MIARRAYDPERILWPLRLAAVLAQLADLVTYLPQTRLETNAVAIAAGPLLWSALKLAFAFGFVWWTTTGIARRMPTAVSAVLVFVALIGAFGAGANVAVLVGTGVLRP